MDQLEPLIVAKNVRKKYGKNEVLNGIDFDIYPGVTGLLGANGAGKTTILGMILGLHHRDSGTLEVFGKDPWSAGAKVREQIGYAPEHHTLPPDFKASEFVQHVAELHGLPPQEAKTRASDALWLVGLGEERFRPMGTMSTGQRQRVKLAQAIAHDPKIIMLDEPTDGLDPTQRDTVLDLITNISTEFGIHIVLSSHLIDEVEKICNGVVIIGNGKTLASGSIEHLKGQTEEKILLELDSEGEASKTLQSLLQESPSIATTTVEGRHMTLEIAAENAFDVVRDSCITADIGIVKLKKKSVSLEDIFIESLG